MVSFWGQGEIQDKYEDTMYAVNRANAEEKLRDFLSRQEQLIDMVNHQATLEALHDRVFEPGVPPLGRIVYAVASSLHSVAYLNWLWWKLSLLTVSFVVYNLASDYTEEYLLEDDEDAHGGNSFFGRPDNDHFNRLYPSWQVWWPARVQVLLALQMLVSHAMLGGALTVISRTRENPDHVVDFGTLGGLLYDKLEVRVPPRPLQTYYVFTNPWSWYYTWYFGCSLLSCLYFYPSYALLLADIVAHNRTMQYILQSITRNWLKLIYSVLFSFIMIIIFATGAFFTDAFRGKYTLGDHMDRRSLLAFVATHLDYGMREAPSFEDDGYSSPEGELPIAG